jgi:hypothetical protein
MYAYTQDVPIDQTTYERIVELLGDEPLEGSLLHLCVRRSDGGLRYIDVWESQTACARAFTERIHPAVDAVFDGARPGEQITTHLEVVHASGALTTMVDPR